MSFSECIFASDSGVIPIWLWPLIRNSEGVDGRDGEKGEKGWPGAHGDGGIKGQQGMEQGEKGYTGDIGRQGTPVRFFIVLYMHAIY